MSVNGITIGTLETNVLALARSLDDGSDFGYDLTFEYNANGYGHPAEFSSSIEFGQNQKWSKMKADTLAMIEATMKNLNAEGV